MDKRFQENNAFYEKYEKSLAVMIFERAKGQIPKSVCKSLAKTAIGRIKYDKAKGQDISMEEYADAYIWAYTQ